MAGRVGNGQTGNQRQNLAGSLYQPEQLALPSLALAQT
jgi:hypothetical protein